jgi:DNA (cytosine-5)-methyltransferase 1
MNFAEKSIIYYYCRRFTVMIKNHWSFGQLRKAMPQYEHEHARVFDNSYVVQWWDMPSKTILAHIHKDGFQFIHPDGNQTRSFTVREAARIQSFPDDFVFAGSRGEKYKQIGNAVPPLFAEALAKSIKKNLRDIE